MKEMSSSSVCWDKIKCEVQKKLKFKRSQPQSLTDQKEQEAQDEPNQGTFCMYVVHITSFTSSIAHSSLHRGGCVRVYFCYIIIKNHILPT